MVPNRNLTSVDKYLLKNYHEICFSLFRSKKMQLFIIWYQTTGKHFNEICFSLFQSKKMELFIIWNQTTGTVSSKHIYSMSANSRTLDKCFFNFSLFSLSLQMTRNWHKHASEIKTLQFTLICVFNWFFVVNFVFDSGFA